MASLQPYQKELYDYLVSESDSTNTKNCFIGYLPDVTNAWSFEPIGSITDRYYPCIPDLSEIISIKGRFAQRRNCFLFNDIMGNILKQIDPHNFDHMNWVKIRSIFNVYPVKRRLFNSKRITTHFETEIRIQLTASKQSRNNMIGFAVIGSAIIG